MSRNQKTGKKGEDLAARHLEGAGYEILERNWRFSRAELDIVCRKEGILVFVEVKTRSYTFFGEPAEFVRGKKERLIMDAANAYMASIGHEWQFRFDIISIVLSPDGRHRLEHVEDAFFPGW